MLELSLLISYVDDTLQQILLILVTNRIYHLVSNAQITYTML